MNKGDYLKTYFGHANFRPGQEPVIDTLLAGRDVMAVMPTGAGKSVCYQIPALMQKGVTLVISPLISLMKDQVNGLVQAGVPAAFINSSLTPAQYNLVCRRMGEGAYKLVYVAPERLEVPSFVELCARLTIPLIAVDEAHCVSQWGQDFRPGYLRIARFIDELPRRPVVGAFTATATERVKSDIMQILRLEDPYTLTTGFDRPNLYFGVKPVRPKEKNAVLSALLAEREGQSGIVYCATRKAVDEVTDYLTARGFSCGAYHAGMSDEDRRQNQEDFLYDRVNIMVATNAFGMGIDKSNVSFVIHYHMPKSMEAYYQEAGRAGRDGSPADCILLYSPADVVTDTFLIEHGEPSPDLTPEACETVRRLDLRRLREMNAYAMSTDCLRAHMLNYFGETAPASCGNCSNCLDDTPKIDITREAQMVLSCVARTKERFGLALIVQILRGSKSTRITELNLDQQTTYGLLKDRPEAFVRAVIQHLIALDALRMTEGEYPVLQLSSAAGDILYRHEPVDMKYRAPAGKSASDKPSGAKSAKKKRRGGDTTSSNPVLYSRLSRLRAELAAEQGVPPFYIFSNATLEDMCVRMPATRADFLDVSGVGQVKLDRYGDAFLEEIAHYRES